ncbi:MAG: strictosidine synthase family protein [Anaerolineales bacterium]|nr:strictosidine synthase family protein [Anaerolineales bacterium]
MWWVVFFLILVSVMIHVLFWPTGIDPVAWTPPPAPKLTGVYARNNVLAGLARIPVGGKAPEDVAVDNLGNLIAGLVDGRIIRVQPDGSHLVTLTHTYGRPLGIVVDGTGRILIADANKGLLSLYPGQKPELLVNQYKAKPLLFTNHLDVTRDGLIYFTDTSTRFPLAHYTADILENRPNGRLFSYNPVSKQLYLLLEGLYFANGVALSADESFLLINETSRYRIRRYWLKGPRAGEDEIFIDNLPGFPDNLSRGPSGLFWCALVSPRKPEIDFVMPYPPLRRLIYRIPERLQPKATRYAFVLGLNEQGEVIHNLQDPTGAFGEVTGVVEHEGYLYLGSLVEEAIGRIKLPT